MSIENLFRPLDGGKAQVFGGLVPAAYGSPDPYRTAKVSNETVGPPEKEKEAFKGDALTDTEKADAGTEFDIDRFEALLNRLEASKGRQQRQKSVEGRRDIFSQGLAGMMSNF